MKQVLARAENRLGLHGWVSPRARFFRDRTSGTLYALSQVGRGKYRLIDLQTFNRHLDEDITQDNIDSALGNRFEPVEVEAEFLLSPSEPLYLPDSACEGGQREFARMRTEGIEFEEADPGEVVSWDQIDSLVGWIESVQRQWRVQPLRKRYTPADANIALHRRRLEPDDEPFPLFWRDRKGSVYLIAQVSDGVYAPINLQTGNRLCTGEPHDDIPAVVARYSLRPVEGNISIERARVATVEVAGCRVTLMGDTLTVGCQVLPVATVNDWIEQMRSYRRTHGPAVKVDVGKVAVGMDNAGGEASE